MIKLENTEVMGWKAAIRGMRNPMNSYDKMDSVFSQYSLDYDGCCWSDSYMHELPPCTSLPKEVKQDNSTGLIYGVGANDYDLMKRLRNAGTDHRKFMRMITVYVDITAPLYWWKEHDQYKIGTTTNSCSTMHKIHAKEFTLEDFSCEHLVMNDESKYHSFSTFYSPEEWRPSYTVTPGNALEVIIDLLNVNREAYVKTGDKRYWWQMIQLLPSSYNQKRTVMLNFEVLANMYKSRKNHKLDEWRDFCAWIEALPYSELITGKFEKEET